MAKEPVTLEFLGEQLVRVLQELGALCRDTANVITLGTQSLEYSRRLEDKFSRDDR